MLTGGAGGLAKGRVGSGRRRRRRTLKNCKKSNFQKKVCVEMKHKKNEPEHPLHFSKYNSPPRTRKRELALLHILPSLFFQLEQQPLKPIPLSQGQALLAHFLFLRGIKLVSPGPYPLLSPLLGMFFPSHSSAGAFAPFWFQLIKILFFLLEQLSPDEVT